MAAGRASLLYMLTSYLPVFFPFLEGPVARPVATLALLFFFSGISLARLRNSTTGPGIGIVLKLTPILILCGFGIATGNLATEFALSEFGTLRSVVLLLFFAFSGTNSATNCAGEVEDPVRTILLSLAAGPHLLKWAFALFLLEMTTIGALEIADLGVAAEKFVSMCKGMGDLERRFG